MRFIWKVKTNIKESKKKTIDFSLHDNFLELRIRRNAGVSMLLLLLSHFSRVRLCVIP